MSSTFGKFIKISLFGESHGSHVGLVVDSLPPGIKIPYEIIEEELEKRKPHGEFETSRKEKDEVQFLSGVKDGYTTGSPLTIVLENKDVNSSTYQKGIIRPSHADYAAEIKYLGYQDYRGGGHFSGRLTAPLVVLGAILKVELEKKNIYVGSHISSLGGIEDDDFSSNILDEIKVLDKKIIAVLNETKKEKMMQKLQKAKENNDSIGGSIKTAICNLPIGVGEPFFDSLESMLAHLIFSIGGVKGILFGDGLLFKEKYGSELNDNMQYLDGTATFLSNHSGGIQGGLSNGEPVLFETIIKPTPSIGKTQKSIDIINKENVMLNINGRHDASIVIRVRAVIDALTRYCVYELLMQDIAKKGFSLWNTD